MTLGRHLLPHTTHARVDAEASTIEIRQLTGRAILAIWAAAGAPDGSTLLARRPGARRPARRRRRRADGEGADRLSHGRTRLQKFSSPSSSVASSGRSAGRRCARRSGFASREPAQRLRRRPDLADPDSLDRGRRSCAGADPDVRGPATETSPRSSNRTPARRSSTAPGAGTAFSRDVPVQHGARRGALFRGYLLPRMNGGVRPRRLDRERRPLHRLPPARAVGHAGHVESFSSLHRRSATERLDGNRGVQCAIRRPRDPGPHARRLRPQSSDYQVLRARARGTVAAETIAR